MIPHNRAVLMDKDGRPTRDWYDWFRRLAEVFEPIGTGESLLSSKQDKLVSGGNIKSVNGESLIGSGDVTIFNTLSYYEDTLSGNVSLTTTGTWYDGPSVTVDAGTWLITAHVCFSRSTATATRWEARIYDSATTYASGSVATPATASMTASIALSVITTAGVSTTFTLQATTDAGNSLCLMRDTSAVNSMAGATKINAVRIA